MELDKATRAQVAAALAAALFGGGLIMIFTLHRIALVIGWFCFASGLVLFAVLLIDKGTRAFLRHPIRSRGPSGKTPRMTGEEAQQRLLDEYWGEDRYRGKAEWNEEEGQAYLTLQCRDEGQIGLRITASDRHQGLRLTHEFHTHVEANGLVVDLFPGNFPDAPKRIAKGGFAVVWEVLVEGGVWLQIATATFAPPPTDMNKVLRRAAGDARTERERVIAEREGQHQPRHPTKNYTSPNPVGSVEGEGRYRRLRVGLGDVQNGYDAGVVLEFTFPDGDIVHRTWNGIDDPETRRQVREGEAYGAAQEGSYRVRWFNVVERGWDPEVIAEETYTLGWTGPRDGWVCAHEQPSLDEIVLSIERTSEDVPMLIGLRCLVTGPSGPFEGGWFFTQEDLQPAPGTQLSIPADFRAAPRVPNLRDGEYTVEWTGHEYGGGEGAGPPVDLGEDSFIMGREGWIEPG